LVGGWATATEVVVLGSPLFRKYGILLAGLVVSAVLASGAVGLWSVYRESREAQSRLLEQAAESAAGRIQQFVAEIATEIGWMTQLPWAVQPAEQRRLDAIRLLRQVPAIAELRIADPSGREQIVVSRVSPDQVGPGRDLSGDPLFRGAVANRVSYGPVYFRSGSEPYMTVAVAGGGRTGVTLAEVNLKLVWDVISRIRIGAGGRAFAVDRAGRLIADPDISRVLQNTDLSQLDQVRAALAAAADPSARPGPSRAATDDAGVRVLAAWAPIPELGWLVFAELPLREADAPLRAALWRIGLLILLGLAISGVASLILARRMVGPIQALSLGAARIGGGELGYRIELRTGDELEGLADSFNLMSASLLEARARADRLSRLRRFLSPQLAELVETSGSHELLESHRREITVVFCDLRGFTSFSAAAPPEEVIRVLNEYHTGLGALIFAHEGTLERYMGDGLMVLFNDPLPCPDPAERAVRMAVAMRDCVAGLAGRWQEKGYRLGFGVGIAQGEATLGRIGFEGRLDYAAIGTVCNLGARLCAEAADGQILIDGLVAAAVDALVDLEPVGPLTLKGFAAPVPALHVGTIRAISGIPSGSTLHRAEGMVG
jgi:adenylate cyclase